MSYSVSTIVEPLTEPVTVDDVKAQARIDLDDENDWITGNITAARQAIEPHLSRSLMPQTNRMVLDCFPLGCIIQLPRSPLRSVTEVGYVDEDGVDQILATSVYGKDIRSEPGSIFLLNEQSWPETRKQPGAVWIDFISGYDDADAVPQPIKNYIMACGAFQDDLRELDVLAVMPVRQLGGYRKPISQVFDSWI